MRLISLGTPQPALPGFRCSRLPGWRLTARVVALIAATSFVQLVTTRSDAADRPNILWVSVEDIGPHLGCYGDPDAVTPTLDRLAKSGMRYTKVFTTCPVCATNRSSIITGMYPTTLGTMHMRCEATLPEEVRCFSALLRDAGYYCTNNWKTDYNFPVPRDAWDENSRNAHWRHREEGQPFFAVINFTTTHESQVWPRGEGHLKRTPDVTPSERQVPSKVTLPPYYPDTPEVRSDWANYLENITQADHEIDAVLSQLREDGLEEDTIVFFWSDHGAGLPRQKRWPYDSGLHVPMIVFVPERWRDKININYKVGAAVEEIVSFIDMAPTVLGLAGLTPPAYMQGQDFLGTSRQPPREYAFGTRDRMDERYDLIRTVRDRRYRYIRNFMPWKPYAQHISFAEMNETMRALRRLDASGSLPPASQNFMATEKPPEELYDLDIDPYELTNLAGSEQTEHQVALRRLREVLDVWQEDTLDLGFVPEPILRDREKRLGDCTKILERPSHCTAVDRVRTFLLFTTPLETRESMALAALDADDPVERYWGVHALSHPLLAGLPASLGSETRVQAAIYKLLGDPEPTVRVAAAEAVGRWKDTEHSLKVLSDSLADQSPWVRLLAVTALAELSPERPQDRATLERSLKDKERYVELVSEWALHDLTGRPVAARWRAP